MSGRLASTSKVIRGMHLAKGGLRFTCTTGFRGLGVGVRVEGLGFRGVGLGFKV